MERRLFGFFGGFLITIGLALFLLIAFGWGQVKSYVEFEAALLVAGMGIADIVGGVLLCYVGVEK